MELKCIITLMVPFTYCFLDIFVKCETTEEKIDDEQCQIFFKEYIESSMNLTECELENASPFRVCTNCIKQYTITQNLYEEFIGNATLSTCKERYLHADRVQVVPTIEKNIKELWDNGNCKSCTCDVHVDVGTKEVNFSVPANVNTFMSLYQNFTSCTDAHSMELPNGQWQASGVGDNSTVCVICRAQYVALNEHYINMSGDKTEGLCMDIVDMMNHTRQNWSSRFHCSHRRGDKTPIILITICVGLMPVFFYGILGLTGKEHKAKLFRQKRLQSSMSSPGDSDSISSLPIIPPLDSTPARRRLI